MNFDKIFWDATLEELQKGFVYLKDEQEYLCLCCGVTYEEGIIYQADGVFMDAKKMTEYHIKTNHGSVFHFLLNMDKKYTGLTDHQKTLMSLFYSGLSDKEIEKETNNTSSTIRNNRFSFREKAKQAKIYLAMMNLLEDKMNNSSENLIPIHRTATSVDERYAITEMERDLYLKKYFVGDKLISFPIKQKRIIIVLQYIASLFEKNRKYTEKDVNEVLKAIYSDYVTIRRYLIEYGFLDRNRDCSEYWVKL